MGKSFEKQVSPLVSLYTSAHVFFFHTPWSINSKVKKIEGHAKWISSCCQQLTFPSTSLWPIKYPPVICFGRCHSVLRFIPVLAGTLTFADSKMRPVPERKWSQANTSFTVYYQFPLGTKKTKQNSSIVSEVILVKKKKKSHPPHKL